MTEAKVADFKQDEENANLGTGEGQEMLERSLAELGAGRSILVDRHGQIIAGNKTQKAALAAGIEDALVIETDGRKLVVVKRIDLDLDEDLDARDLAYYDNRTGQLNLQWDGLQLAADWGAGLSLDRFFGLDEIGTHILSTLQVDGDTVTEDPDSEAEDPQPTEPVKVQVPDALWPTDNEWGIPALLPEHQATAVELPVALWGARGRKHAMHGTYLFYVDDYRFEALWKDPAPIVNSACQVVAEPNYTIAPQTPKAYALYLIYRKRWLARYWQSYGIKVLVDLNIDVNVYRDIALLGVPAGWRAYVTRGYTDRLDSTRREYEFAVDHAGTNEILFLVYGGGRRVEQEAFQNGWVWVPEVMDVKRGGIAKNG